ncbi:hypothetical protein SD37_23400 [Amycolatopsis orientalis]|uniref:Uncharacterized protein n=2 Tax=Amycolatopsis orientalis TaxID=31958 RepID=A0A193C1D9_AMYOR|nr:hypothetical protein SD37_23400 [Amycolatopsis orientalis]
MHDGTTGGIVCANVTTARSREPAAPVGPPEAPAKLNGKYVHKGHLVPARPHGSVLVDNIVSQWSTVDLFDVERVENAVGDAAMDLHRGDLFERGDVFREDRERPHR